jgi:serine protease Do
VTGQPWEGFGKDFFKGTPFEDFFRGYGGPLSEQKQVGEGSRGIVDPRDYILTNYYVVVGAGKLPIRLFDGRELKGTIQEADPKTDLAVVCVDAKDLPVATLGDSDKLQVGEWAIAIGSPFGLEETVTVGMISAIRTHRPGGRYLRRLHPDRHLYQSWEFRWSAREHRWEVVGINAMIIQPGQGIGFAIPTNLAKNIVTDLIKHREVVRPWVGIGLQDLSPDLREHFNLKEEKGL